MRLRRGVLAVGLMLMSVMAVGPGAVASEPGDAKSLPTIDAAAEPSPTGEPTAVPSPTGEPTVAPSPTGVSGGEQVPVHVAVWLCDGPKCPEPTGVIAGVTVGAVDAAGQVLAQCVTAGDPAGCDFTVPAGADWTFSWDESAVPEGYIFDSVAVVTGGGWEGEAYIIQFVPSPVEPQVETVHVGVMLCESADCEADGTLLAGIGVASVDTATNTQVDNCETAGDPAVCAIDVPLYAPWTFTWDATAIPDGYHFIGELAVVQGGAYPVVYLIRLVPDGVPTVTPAAPTVPPTAVPAATKAPVTALPKTGAGSDTPAGAVALAAMLAVAAAGLAGLGVASARRGRRG